jgi:hypothetical protein
MSRATFTIRSGVIALLFLAGCATGFGDTQVDGALEVTGATTQTGAFTVTGATALNGGLAMDTNKFTVADTSGNTAIAGTLDVTGATTLDGGLAMDTNKFTVADTSGNTAIAGTLGVTGDATFGGGAGCITTSGSGDSTLVAADADSTAFCMGAAGALDLVCLDTTDASPAWDIKGVVGQVGLHVDAGTVQVDESAAVTGNATVGGTLGVTGDATFGGGAGAITTSGSGDSTLVAADADSTAFCMGAAGALDLVCLDTTDASPAWDIKGVVGQVGLHVDAGTVQVDETLTVTSDISANGGAGCLTVSGSGDATLVAADADSTAFCMGAAGALDLVCLDTTDASPSWDIKGVSGQVGLHLDAGTALIDEDLSIGGGAGAITLTHSDSSCVLPDNDATAADFGAVGETAMIRFVTTDDAENVLMRSPVTFTGVYETFGEGADKGYQIYQIDGTAYDGTAAVYNHAYFGAGNILAITAMGDNQASAPTMTANGWDIAGDQADNEGNEVVGGVFGATGRPMIIGTDVAWYFLMSFQIGDIDGTDTFMCGLRTFEVHNNDYTAYDTYATMGTTQSADPMVIEIVEEINGDAGAVTDTTDTLQDATNCQFKFLVATDGTTTFQHDADTPGTLEAPDAVTAFQFDDGDMVIPFCHYREHNAGGLADTVEIQHWEIGYQ